MTNIEKLQAHNAEQRRLRAEFSAAAHATIDHLEQSPEDRQLILSWVPIFFPDATSQEQH